MYQHRPGAVTDPTMTASDPRADGTEQSTGRDQRHPLAETHVQADAGGHWWNKHNVDDLPDWYAEKELRPQYSESAAQKDSGRDFYTPDVPDDVDWSDYEVYHCIVCNDPCINRSDSEAYELKQCWSCVSLPSLDEPEGATDEEVREAIEQVEEGSR